jgi:hypothetical protein
VVGQLAGLHNGDGWFRPVQVDELLEVLRVPGGNTSRALGLLETERLVLRRRAGGGVWALTPLGEERVLELFGALDPNALAPQLEGLPGAEFGHELHTIIPPSLAPIRWAAGIERLLKEYPFDTNVFCMTRFPKDEDDVVGPVVEAAREALDSHGLTLHLASDRVIDEDLLANVAAHMWACQYGVALFEDRTDAGLNLNLLIEVGAMVTSGRRCALLKDTTAPAMPTDLVGQIYKPVDFDDVSGISAVLHEWAADDLGLGRRHSCP